MEKKAVKYTEHIAFLAEKGTRAKLQKAADKHNSDPSKLLRFIVNNYLGSLNGR